MKLQGKGRLKEAMYNPSLGRNLKTFSKLIPVHLTVIFALEKALSRLKHVICQYFLINFVS